MPQFLIGKSSLDYWAVCRRCAVVPAAAGRTVCYRKVTCYHQEVIGVRALVTFLKWFK